MAKGEGVKMEGGVRLSTPLARFRAKEGKTLKEMAKKIGVSYGYYIRVEYRQQNPSYRFVLRFARAFPDADLRRLFFGLTYAEFVRGKK